MTEKKGRRDTSRRFRNILLVLEYDGSAFAGFQRQPKHPSVQQALEEAMARLFGEKTKIKSASGRTDSGVHAACQVVNFKTHSPRPLAEIHKALNAILPKAIAVKEVREVPAAFHARFDARSKTYEYTIWNSPVRSPLFGGRALHVIDRLDVARMRAAARHLVGKHDFAAFCAADSKAKKCGDTVRTVKRLAISRQGFLLRLRVEADGFLYHMVRNMVGILLDAGRKKVKAGDVRRILESRDRRLAPATAPANGLCLVEVTY